MSRIRIRTLVGNPGKGKHKALLLPLFQAPWPKTPVHDLVDSLGDVKASRLVQNQEIRGEFKEFTILHAREGKAFERVLLIGAGKEKDCTADLVRSISAKASRTLRKIRSSEMTIVPEVFPGIDPETLAQAVVEGAILGLYRFEKYVSEKRAPEMTPDLLFLARDKEELAKLKKGAEKGEVLAEATLKVRDLANHPGNTVTPTYLGEHAKELGKRDKVTVTVFDEKALKKMGMGGILSVSQGSDEPPRLIVAKYRGGGDSAPHLAFVGKGITFDSGGISIKPADAMHQMKYDMSGAAAVLGALDAISQLKLKINVTAVVPSSENLPGPKAYKPGDVIKMYGGKYVEIINTDAEGRMLLADALVYATEQKPDLIVDIATLTGGCVIALGHIASGVMGNQKWLVDRVIEGGHRCDEKMWQLPLFPEYLVQIRSTTAEWVNSGGRPASAITAGLFLRQFVGKVPWAHIDIAGTAWIEEDTTLYIHKPYLPKRGATGVGVRSLVALAEILLEQSGGSKKKLAELIPSLGTEA